MTDLNTKHNNQMTGNVNTVNWQKLAWTNWGPSINYVVSKSEIFDHLPPSLSSFLLSMVYLVNRLWGYPPPPLPLPRRHSLWTAPYPLTYLILYKGVALEIRNVEKFNFLVNYFIYRPHKFGKISELI